MNASDHDVLRELLAPPGAIVAAPQAPANPAPARPKLPSLYDLLMTSMAHAAALLMALGLWWIGAQFTLQFLKDLGLNLAALGLAQWLIPLAITAIEVKFWPHRGQNRHLLSLFLIVAGVDLLTSVVGGHGWMAERVAATWTGSTAGWLWVASLVLALVCALWPEKLARAALKDLLALWRV